MKRLYTLALSALVLAASASVAGPTMKMAKTKTTQLERLSTTQIHVKKSVTKRHAESETTENETSSATLISFDFVNNQYGIDNVRGGSEYFKDAELDSAGVKMVFHSAKGNGFRFWTDGLRIYKTNNEFANSITISAPEHTISAITLNAKSKIGEVYVNGSTTSQKVSTGENKYICDNTEEVVLEFKVTDSNAIKTITVELDGTPSEVVTPEIKEVANIAAFLAAKDLTNVTTITGDVTVTYQKDNYLFVTDATGSMEVYGNVDQTYTNGTVLSNISGTYSEYNKMPQFAPEASSFTAGTQGESVAPVEFDAATVQLAQYIRFTDVEITENGGKFYADGIQLYNQFKIDGLEIKAAEKATITGIYGLYNSTNEIFVISINYDGESGGNEPGEDPDPVVPTPGDEGTESNPYTVAQAIANNSGQAWVKGYIVGTMDSGNGNTLETSAPFSVPSNILIADNATETEPSKMLPVQLVNKTEIRSAVNLVDNPENLGKVLCIEGTLTTYFQQPGLKSPTNYSLSEGESGGDDPVNPNPGEDLYTVADVVGNYEVSYVDEIEGYIYGNDMTVTAGEGENVLIFNMPFEFDDEYIWSLVGKLDPKTGNITFVAAEQPILFEGAMIDFSKWDYEAAEYNEVTEIVANYDGTTVVFDDADGMGLYDEEGYYYMFFDTIEMTKVDPNADPNEGWKSLGNANFMDGWVIPLFGENQADYIYEVELQQNETNANLYRLVDPYHGNSPIADFNECTKAGYIEFDVTDPDNVIFSTNVKAGFALAEVGLSNIYCYDYMSFFCSDFEMTPEEVNGLLAEYGEDPIASSTYKNGVITVNEACFGISATEGGYGWQDEDGTPANMDAKIWFPGVTPEVGGGDNSDSIHEISAADGEAVIYNLHGQRVSKATRGIYILNNQKVLVK